VAPGGLFLGQTAYGVDPLPVDGGEAVAQKWVAVVSRENDRTMTCINDGCYGCDYSEDGLRLTLLRSPAYANHPMEDGISMPQDCFMPRQEQGERIFRFWLNSGKATPRLKRIDREALAKNEKPFALSFFPSGFGKKPKPLVVLGDDTVQMSCIKKAERNNDLVILKSGSKVAESAGQKGQTDPPVGITSFTYIRYNDWPSGSFLAEGWFSSRFRRKLKSTIQLFFK
jgi:alpha-mannosidase